MFRLWAKIWKENHLIKDITICNSDADTRTHKVMKGLAESCLNFDLPNPIWLESTIADFKRNSKCRFGQDSFIEPIDFDFLEIHIIEED